MTMKNKKPVALLMTDTHLKDGNMPLIKSIFEQAVETCKKYNIKRIFHLGDWFTERSKQSLECLMAMSDTIIDMVVDNDIALFGIIGNHDKTDQTDTKGYISLYKHKFKLFEDESVVKIGDILYCFLSFFEDEEYLIRLANLIVAIERRDPNNNMKHVLFTHQSINGVRNNDGSVVSKDIETEFFANFDKVFVGHYHDEQEFDIFHYIGSTHQANFGENNRKGFKILYDDLSTKHIQAKFPEYIHLKIPVDSEEIADVIEEFGNTDNNVRVTLIGDKDTAQTVKKELFKNTGIEVRHVSISESKLLEASLAEISDDVKVFESKDLMKYWMKYSSSVGIDKNIRNLGLKLLKNEKEIN